MRPIFKEEEGEEDEADNDEGVTEAPPAVSPSACVPSELLLAVFRACAIGSVTSGPTHTTHTEVEAALATQYNSYRNPLM